MTCLASGVTTKILFDFGVNGPGKYLREDDTDADNDEEGLVADPFSVGSISKEKSVCPLRSNGIHPCVARSPWLEIVTRVFGAPKKEDWFCCRGT